MALTLGQPAQLSGDVTRLNWVAARSPGLVEQSLGYESGRLADGYYVAVLKEKLRANQVRFAGLTTRSGGRLGLPSSDPVQDKARIHNHDRMLAEYGTTGVKKMLEKLADNPLNLSGPERIVKIVPVTRHVGANPAQEYPPGGGGPQFTLDVAHLFFIAAEVSPTAIAQTADLWSVSVGPNAPYDGRARLAKYLESA